MTSIADRRAPAWAFPLSAHAESESDVDADSNWNGLIEGLGLGKRPGGNLPGFRFERESGIVVGEGARLNAFWASGGGDRIHAVVRSWNPQAKSLELDIVHDDDGCTWRTYNWQIKPLDPSRSVRQLNLRLYVSLNPLRLLQVIFFLPFLKSVARDAV